MSKLSFKKSTAAIITALMLIAIAMPMLSLASAAAGPPTLSAVSGNVGSKITVSGSSTTLNAAQPGSLVSIFLG